MPRLRRSLFIDVAAASRVELDRDAVLRVERRFNTIVTTDRRVGLGLVFGTATMIISGLVIGVSTVQLVEWLGGSTLVVGLVAGIVTPTSLILIWWAVIPRILRRAMRRALRDCGHDVCVQCGYCLDGLAPQSACPECGRITQPACSEPDPR